MKSQTEFISVDEFKLQLNEMLQAEKELRSKVEQKEQSFVHKLQVLPMSISSAASTAYFSIHLLWIIHLVFCYIICFHNAYTLDSFFLSIYNIIESLSNVGLIINGCLIAIILLSLIFPKMEKDAGVFFLFRYAGSQIYPYVRYLIEMAVYSTSFFCLSQSRMHWILFSLAVLPALFSTALLQNVTLRKYEFCCKSVPFCLTWRAIMIVSLIVGVTGTKNVSSGGQLVLWGFGQMTLGIILLVGYYSFGIYTYRHKVPRYCLFFLLCMFSSLSAAAFFDSLSALKRNSLNYPLHAPLLLITMTFFNWSTLEKRRREAACPQNKNLKEKIYFIFNKFEHCDVDEEDDCEIRGILHYHMVCECPNQRCFTNLKEVYDSKKKKYCSISKIGAGRVSLVKFYVKCLFETALQENPDDIELRLDFIQFYYLKLKNLFCVLKQIYELQKRLLGPLQQLRLIRLKKIMQSECNGFSEDLYLRNLSMEKAVEAQQIFVGIQKKIELVIRRNELFWKYIERNEVFLTDILNTIRPNFALIDQLNDQWSKIADYFSINRRWKFYYLCFTLFIKNEKLKPTDVQDFGNSVQYDAIFKTGNHFIDKTTQKQALYNPIMLFEQNTCFVSATCDEEKMLIKRVSNYFKRNFDYEPRDIINSPLHILMPPSIRSFHHKLFLSWVKEGRTNNEEYYSVKKIMPLTSQGYLAPSFKFYKYYLRSDSEVQYVAMFKRNKKDDMLLLVNDKFEIQAITQGLAQKLKIQDHDYDFFRGLNLLSLIPMLAKYTYYGKFIEERDEDFLENDENQVYFKKQSSYIKTQTEGQNDILSLRKVLNLTNVKMYIPTDLQGACQQSKALKREKKESEFQFIRRLYDFIIKNKNFSKFKGEMYIYERNYRPYTDTKFYELQINQLEDNNRLQKLKAGEEKQQKSSEGGSKKQIDEVGEQDLDMNAFLQLNKKRNKVVLVPSNNIFLKDQNNQALTEIKHISSISMSIRLIIVVFITILIIALAIELSSSDKLTDINTQYYLIYNNQKLLFTLNGQYNIQHMNLGYRQQGVFYIEYQTESLEDLMSESLYQKMLYDQQINSYSQRKPYFSDPYPYPILQNFSNPVLGSIAIFTKMRETAISLNYRAIMDMNDQLENKDYHIYNNYLYQAYSQAKIVKTNLEVSYYSHAGLIKNTAFIVGILEVVLIILCFLFSFNRLLKVTNGFSELLSIFIQMDNIDIKKILRFVDYSRNLFNHLRYKYEKMAEYVEGHGSASYQDLQKPSSDHGIEEMASTTNANLNKKLKKIDLGNEIKDIQCKATALIVAFLVLVGLSLSIPIIYSIASINQLNQMQKLGFTIMVNGSLPNGIMSGIFQKFRGAQIYRYEKYSTMLDDFTLFIKSSIPLQISSGDSELSKMFKDLYFQDFCLKHPFVLRQQLAAQISTVCDAKYYNATICSFIRANFTSQYLLNRCRLVQNEQLTKGALSFYVYLINKYSLFFKNALKPSAIEMIQLNDAQRVMNMYQQYLAGLWRSLTSNLASSRLVSVVLTTIAALILIVALHITFVEYIISNNLSQNYEMFRRMHENLIPEFVINKEKIIKAKLIKEGFMKE